MTPQPAGSCKANPSGWSSGYPAKTRPVRAGPYNRQLPAAAIVYVENTGFDKFFFFTEIALAACFAVSVV